MQKRIKFAAPGKSVSDAAPAFSYYDDSVAARAAGDVFVVFGEERVMAAVAEAQDIFFAFPFVFFFTPLFADPEEGESNEPCEDVYYETG